MPRPTHSPSPSPHQAARGVKREAASDGNSSDEDVKRRKKAKGRSTAGGAKRSGDTGNGKAVPRKWSGDELDTLLTIALKHGPSIANFEGKIAGRTGNQCMRTWLVTVVPFLHKAVREKGGAKE